MEPWAGLQCASAVLSFATFARSVLSTTYKIHRNSTRPFENEDLSAIADTLRHLKTVIEDLSPMRHATLSADQQLAKRNVDLISSCKSSMAIADEIASAIGDIVRPGKEDHTVWNSFRQALRTIWSQEKVASLRNRLHELHQKVQLLIATSISNDIRSEDRLHTVNLALETQRLACLLGRNLEITQSWQAAVLLAIEKHMVTPDPGQEDVVSSSCPVPSNIVRIWKELVVEGFAAAVLQELKYEGIDDRYEAIPEAHAKTFQWVFESNAPGHGWDSFTAWLDGPLEHPYWITGKPGSGKSTLMKLICDAQIEKQNVQSSSDGVPVMLLSFYFWNSGTEKQMSQEGLLRRLLLNAFRQQPDLLPVVFPDELKNYTILGRVSAWHKPWTPSELARLMKVFLRAASLTSTILIFIDGLDEFRGAPQDMIGVLKDLQCPNVKLCVSSRPWPIFEDSFAQGPSLRMEDLTQEDIRCYVTDKFSQSLGYRTLRELDSEGTDRLVQNLLEKARGVFLWIHLVMDLLLNALSEGEILQDLQRHVQTLPSDLNNLFDNIMDSLQVDPIRFRRTSEIFQILLAASEPLRVVQLSFAMEPDPEVTFGMPHRKLASAVENALSDLVRRQVTAYSKCLLEVQRKRGVHLADCSVGVIHRTVNDYLHSPRVWNRILTGSDKSFNPALRLCLAQIAFMKSKPRIVLSSEDVGEKSPSNMKLDTMKIGVQYAKTAEPLYNAMQDRLMQQLHQSAVSLSGSKLVGRAVSDYANKFDCVPEDQNQRMPVDTICLEEQAFRSYKPLGEQWPCLHRPCREKSAWLYLARSYHLTGYIGAHIRDIPQECRNGYEITFGLEGKETSQSTSAVKRLARTLRLTR